MLKTVPNCVLGRSHPPTYRKMYASWFSLPAALLGYRFELPVV
jgi:hypothetical protein